METVRYIIDNPGVLVFLVPLLGTLAMAMVIGISELIDDIRK